MGGCIPKRAPIMTVPSVVLGLRGKEHQLASACEVSMVLGTVVGRTGGVAHFGSPDQPT